jgi:hypothetical protein
MNRDDSVSSSEMVALQGRIGHEAEGLRGTAHVRDVAEATGLTDVEVMAHLRQIRAEAGFHPEEPKRAPALPYIAGAAMLTAMGVTWWRLQNADDSFRPAVPASPPITVTPVAPTTIRSLATTSLSTTMIQEGPAKPPPGFRVEVIGQRTDKMGDGLTSETKAIPYAEARNGLARSAETLVPDVFATDGPDPAPPGTRYHGMNGGIFSPRVGFVHLAMFGWAGSEFGWIPVPLTDAGRKQIAEMAVKTLADAKATQDEALRPAADYRKGIVLPPPGFHVRFAGRRLDARSGPRVSFSDLSVTAVADRLESSLLNAIYRDGRPPVGTWSGNAEQDAKIPQPSLSRVEITGPVNTVAADIPTRPGDEGATKRTVRALAERLAQQVKVVTGEKA